MSDRAKPDGYGFYGGPLSSFAYGPFVIDVHIQWPEADVLGPLTTVPTIEHYFQAAKARDRGAAELVRMMLTPRDAKQAGRRIPLREDWEEIKYDVMLHGLRAKFATAKYRDALLATGSKRLYENSPTDAVWGLWNPRENAWTGQNLLGQALMQIRAELSPGPVGT